MSSLKGGLAPGGNMEQTLGFAVHPKVLPMIETFPLDRAAEVFEKMMTAKVHFRAVPKKES